MFQYYIGVGILFFFLNKYFNSKQKIIEHFWRRKKVHNVKKERIKKEEKKVGILTSKMICLPSSFFTSTTILCMQKWKQIIITLTAKDVKEIWPFYGKSAMLLLITLCSSNNHKQKQSKNNGNPGI